MLKVGRSWVDPNVDITYNQALVEASLSASLAACEGREKSVMGIRYKQMRAKRERVAATIGHGLLGHAFYRC